MAQKQISIDELELGMYVDQLDRPWLGTPFPLKGLLINSREDIEAVRALCRYVYINVEKGRDVTPEPLRHAATPQAAARAHNKMLVRKRIAYDAVAQVPFHDELNQAKEIHHAAQGLISSMHEDIRAGRSIDTAASKQLVHEMVDSIIRNPSALIWLTVLKKVDEYTAIHSINVCILSLAFGRHMTLAPDALRELGLAALLHDMGKIKVPVEILNKPGRLSDDEFEEMKRHPAYGAEILARSEGLSPLVLDVAQSHHERASGQGYPKGLTSRDTSLFARMVAIVDFYDALTSDRVYRLGLSSGDVVKSLYETRGRDFDAELVEQFIRCLGIFPIGSLVEFATGEVGIVTALNPARGLKPLVMLVLDRDKQPLLPPRMANLWQLESHNINYEIKHILPPGSFGVYPPDFVSQVDNTLPLAAPLK